MVDCQGERKWWTVRERGSGRRSGREEVVDCQGEEVVDCQRGSGRLSRREEVVDSQRERKW